MRQQKKNILQIKATDVILLPPLQIHIHFMQGAGSFSFTTVAALRNNDELHTMVL